jgi:hypothetical protein
MNENQTNLPKSPTTYACLIAALVTFFVLEIKHPLGAINYDGFELATAAYTLGVTHPPGYAIYNMLTKLVCTFLGNSLNPIYCLAVFSFLCGIASMIAMALIHKKSHVSQALCVGLILNITGFYYISTVVEVYSFQLLLLLFLYYFRDKNAFGFYLLCGVLTCHHTSCIPWIGLLVLHRIIKHEKPKLRQLAIALIAPLFHFFYLYIVTTQNRFNFWLDLTNFNNLWHHFSGNSYFQSFTSAPSQKQMLFTLNEAFKQLPQWLWVLLALCIVFGWVFNRDEMKKNWLLPVSTLLFLCQNLFYRIPDIWVYQVIPIVFLCCYAAYALNSIKNHPMGTSGLLILILGYHALNPTVSRLNYDYFFNQSQIHAKYAMQSSKLPVFIGYDELYQLFYLKHCEQELPKDASIFPAKTFSSPAYNHWLTQKFSNDFTFPALPEYKTPYQIFSKKQHVQLVSEWIKLNQDKNILFSSKKPKLFKAIEDANLSHINHGLWNKVVPKEYINPIHSSNLHVGRDFLLILQSTASNSSPIEITIELTTDKTTHFDAKLTKRVTHIQLNPNAFGKIRTIVLKDKHYPERIYSKAAFILE